MNLKLHCTGKIVLNIYTEETLIFGRFYTKGALSVWTNLSKFFVVRLVMRLKYKDGHKTHYVSRRTTFRNTSFKTYFEGKFVQTHNASCARLYT